MKIADILVAHGLVTRADIAAAMELQRGDGAAIGDCLVRLGLLAAEDLERVLRMAPRSPLSLEDTGLSAAALLNLMVKVIHVNAEATVSDIGSILKLPPRAVQVLIDLAKERSLLDLLGAVRQGGPAEIRYTLTSKGADWARQAMEQNEYMGPAPVPLAVYCEQIHRQRIANERVDRASVDTAFKDLVISPEMVREIGPAVNSGRSILLYGPPGNGKTSIGERVGTLFREVIYIPYCFEVEGQIIKVFDPAVHKQVEAHADEYRLVFRAVAGHFGLVADDAIIDEVIDQLRVRNDFPLASFQPKFIVDQVRAAAKFDGVAPVLSREYVVMALRNLYTKDTPGYGPRAGIARAAADPGRALTFLRS